MKQKKIGYIGWAMRHHNIVFILVGMFVLFGIYALFNMPRNEFPNFTIRQGLVVGVYPGASSEEVEEQLTKQVENYIFGFKEVKKAKTYSESKEGMMIIYVELNDNVKNSDEFWSKLKHGLNELKQTLPPGVVALIGNNDFGDTSALLITLSSDTKSYKELESELKKLKAECRKISSVSKIKEYGIQKEKIYVDVAPEKLNEYNIKSISLLSSYMSNGSISPAGSLKNGENNLAVHFPPNFSSEQDLADQIVFADPMGGVVRLKDIASIERRNQDPESYIRQNGKNTILLSLEMQTGNNIVQFGEEVEKALAVFKKQCPQDIQVNTISNLPKYVDNAVTNFMKEFLIAIIAVIFVVMLLLPKSVASIAGLTVPIAVLITLGLLYFFGIELNTVSLAGLIIVLGMIVDNAIVVIDNYVEKKDHGMSSWHAAIKSARELVTPIMTATLAICVVYIPLSIMLPGTAGDFVRDLPVTICTALIVSIIVALFVVPFLNFYFIKKGLKSTVKQTDKKSVLDKVQGLFDKNLEKAFLHPKFVLGSGIAAVVLAIVLFLTINQQLFPNVERNQFAVEVYLPKGASIESTAKVIDSLESCLRKDERVTEVTSFIGSSSPRFHTMYAPSFPSSNYGQLMVNTTDNKATEAIFEEYNKRFEGAFPNAHVKWKILAMQMNKYPIELRISGDSITDLRKVEADIYAIIKDVKGINWIRTDWEQKQQNIQVNLDTDKASRMGYSKGLVASSVLVGLNGIPLTTIWENDYPVEVRLTQDNNLKKDMDYLGNQYITSPMSFSAVPLRSIATLKPSWTEGTIVHRNGTRNLTVQLDIDPKVMAANVLKEIKPQLDKLVLPEGATLNYGGDAEAQVEVMHPMAWALIISIIVIFFILLFQFKKVKLSLLIMSTMLLGLPGVAIGLFVMGFPFGLTAFIGLTSLCGIVVRNGIILIDYLQELRTVHGMSVKEAALAAGKRRMRPIFLTSAAAAVGVIPMIISRSPLWGPLGTVICFGLIISMILTLFVLPVLYTAVYKDKTNGKRIKKHIPYSNIVPMIALILIGLTAFPSQSSAQKRVLTLDSCKVLALENNAKIKEASIEVSSALEIKKEAFTNYFPKLSASGLMMRSSNYLINGQINQMNIPVYNGNPLSLLTATEFAYIPETKIQALNYANYGSLSLVQPIFTGGRIYNGNKLARLNYDISKLKAKMTNTEVKLKTDEIYWKIVSLEEKLQTVIGYEKMLEQLQKDATVAVNAGLIQRSDLLKVQLKSNELKVNKLKLENGILLTKQVFCQHLGIPFDANIELDKSKQISSLPETYLIESYSAVRNRNEYQLREQAVKAQSLQKKMAVGENLPQLAIGGQAFVLDAVDVTQTQSLGFVTLSVPISDWWAGSHKIKEADLKIQQAENKLNETEDQLLIQIEMAKNELQETYFEINTAILSVEQAKENLKVINDNYTAGVNSMTELLEAQALLQDAQNQHIDAVCSYNVKIAHYLQAIGKY